MANGTNGGDMRVNGGDIAANDDKKGLIAAKHRANSLGMHQNSMKPDFCGAKRAKRGQKRAKPRQKRAKPRQKRMK